MADTTTPVYSFVLPEIDGSDGTWGTKLNANLTALDGLLSGSANLQNASFTGTASFGGSTGTAGQVLKSQGAGANAIWTDDSNTTYTAGSGLSLTGTEFANTAPDQTVVMNAGSGISVSGTYPTFTVTNSSPDQTVALTGTGGTTISGTYPNFTINSTDTNTTYTAGTGLTLTSTEFSVTDNGIGALQLNVSGNGTSGQVLASDGDGSFSWTSAGTGGNETLAQTLALGAVTGGTDISVSSGDNIVMAANSTVDGRDVSVDGTKLDGIEASADVTDTANVTAAGALMDSELTSEASVKALNQGVATGDSPTFAGLTVDTDTLYVDSTNNRVGVGTTSPSRTLHLKEAVPCVRFEDTDASGVYHDILSEQNKGFCIRVDEGNVASGSYFRVDIDDSEKMRIDSSGNVGIGTSLPRVPLHVDGASGELMRLSVTPNSGSQQTFGLGFATGANTHPAASINALEFDASDSRASLLFSTRGSNSDSAATERMRISESGNVSIGTVTSPANLGTSTDSSDTGMSTNTTGRVTFASNNTYIMTLNRYSSNGQILRFSKDGVITGSISTNGNSLPSDRNFKKNISDLALGLDFVNSLSPKTYNYNIDDEGQPVMTGLIAQEVEAVLTAAGIERNSMTLLQYEPTENVNDSDYQMDYVKFVPILINSIKEQQALIESLTARIAALENS